MKKIAVLMLSLLLLLTGCVQNAGLLTDAIKQGLDNSSFEASTTVRLDTNLPVEQMGSEMEAALQLLKDGVIIKSQQKNDREAHATILLQNPAGITGTEFWPFEIDPALDLYMDGGNLYVKSTVDDKFLGSSTGETDISEDDTELLKELVLDFINQYQYVLPNVNNAGEETVGLPDGSKETATHLQITLDFQEAVNMTVYTLENLSKFEGLEQLITEFSKYSGMDDSEAAPDALKELTDSLATAAQEVKALNVEELKAAGWNVELALDFWITPEKQIAQDKFKLKVQVPGEFMPEYELPAIDFTLDISSQYWNHNQAVDYPVPAEDQIVMDDQLAENPELLDSFAEGSPIRMFAELSALPPMEYEDFADVTEEHWAYEEINTLKMMDIVQGYGDNTFKPNQSITRAEFVKMTVDTLGLEAQTTELNFTDKNELRAWSEEYVQTAVKAGLIKGYDDGTFRPNQNISRAEMVTILVRGLELELEEEYQLSYADKTEIHAWALPYVKTATANQLVQGRSENRFAPKEQASRAEVTAVLYRIMMQE
ncbi:S-layer homology domain-containing protein [Paenibacillus tarimensis]